MPKIRLTQTTEVTVPKHAIRQLRSRNQIVRLTKVWHLKNGVSPWDLCTTLGEFKNNDCVYAKGVIKGAMQTKPQKGT